MPARLLLLFRSSWLTVEGDCHVGAAGVLHRRGGRAAVAVSVGVAGGVPIHKHDEPPSSVLRLLHSVEAARNRAPVETLPCRPIRQLSSWTTQVPAVVATQ